MKAFFIDSILEVTEADWSEAFDVDYAFANYSFLSVLERCEVTTLENGWQVKHLLVKEDEKLVGFMPCYLKYHSYGEFVFDFQWAAAYERNGIAYYPKLLTAIPYTPATGPRVLVRDGYDFGRIVNIMVDACKKYVSEHNLSSWHTLFPNEVLQKVLKHSQLQYRSGVQFHWFNNHYQSFDDFLIDCNSRHRKKIRKERKKVLEQDIELKIIEGKDITPMLWELFYAFYQRTYIKRSGHGGYLNSDFFQCIGKTMPDNLVMVCAFKGNDVVAAALNFRDGETLYGRYWGCSQDFDFLHFETCYYQGIDYCIDKGLVRFDPGAQGEHKIQRGFKPVYTASFHWIADKAFRDAIDNFLVRENQYTELYYEQATKLLPFRKAN